MLLLRYESGPAGANSAIARAMSANCRYDAAILGHELAGRAALSVAMNTGRVPVVQLNEVGIGLTFWEN